MDYNEEVSNLMRNYYTHYYRDELGIPYWKTKVDARLSEEETFLNIFPKLKIWLSTPANKLNKILIVGGVQGLNLCHLLY